MNDSVPVAYKHIITFNDVQLIARKRMTKKPLLHH